MEIRIITLSENTANYGFLAEWGISVLIEVDGMKISWRCNRMESG